MKLRDSQWSKYFPEHMPQGEGNGIMWNALDAVIFEMWEDYVRRRDNPPVKRPSHPLSTNRIVDAVTELYWLKWKISDRQTASQAVNFVLESIETGEKKDGNSDLRNPGSDGSPGGAAASRSPRPPLMRVEIQRIESANPITYENVINAFSKGDMYCVLFEKEGRRVTHKFPISTIFRIVEDYPESKR